MSARRDPEGSRRRYDDLARRFPRAFVTGAAGFIGSHVVKRLIDERVAVTALVLPGDPAPALRGLDYVHLHGDLASADWLADAMVGVDLVFHLAAIYAIWTRDPKRLWDVNVSGTRNVLAAARKAGVTRVVHTSSMATIGERAGRVASTEDDPFTEWDGDDYVRSKYAAELEAMAARDLDVVVVNPAFPFGANDYAPTPTGKLVRDTLAGRMPFVTDGGFNVVDVRDVAEGHLLAALHGTSGRRYILGGDNLGFREFADRVAQIAQRPAPRWTVPTPLLVGAAAVSEWIAALTHRPPLMTRRSAAYLAGRWRWVSSQRAADELGYKPGPIDAAIGASVAWFRGQR